MQEFLAAKDDDSWLFEDKDDKESAKSEVFHKLDLDGNGVLTLDELQVAPFFFPSFIIDKDTSSKFLVVNIAIYYQTGAAHLGLSVEEATELFATLDKNGEY